MKHGITILDVFSGAGGLSLGWLSAMRDCGANLIGLVDADPTLAPVHKENFPGTRSLTYSFAPVDSGDVEEVRRALNVGRSEVDVLLAGPPCQSVSSAGKRAAHHLDNRLALRVADLARALRPKVVAIENVPEFAWAEDGRLVGRVRVQLASSGYETQVAILNATSFGVPQVRQRCFILAVAREEYRRAPGSLAPTPSTSTIMTARSPVSGHGDLPLPPTVHDAISDLPQLLAGEGAEVGSYDRDPFTAYQRRLRNGLSKLFNHVAVNHSPEMVAALANLGPGDTPQRQANHPLRRKDYFRSAYARLVGDGVAPTMTTQTQNPGSGRFTHPTQNRVLTVREVARIQGFPDSFRFLGDNGTQRRHVGNAVPPAVAAALAAGLSRYL
ncbi:MAG TPA: DNA cytosine methyltransferase [Vicinamibacterales bacterium]|jgi:DNA (cytosine-5)-methyltransferase 1